MVVDGGMEANLGVNSVANGSRWVESIELEAGVTVSVERAESPRSVVVGDEVGVTRRQ